MFRPLILILFAAAWLPVLAVAQTDYERLEALEAERQKAFQDGMADIVADLNAQSFARFVAAIDTDDMVERIFGLRLIDPRIKRDFREDMQEPGRFADFVRSTHYAEVKDGIKAKLLIVESRGDRGRAVIRFDMPHFQVNYMEYDLRLDEDGKLVILDWTDYLWGHTFSERMGLSMVQAHPNVNAVRKLIDFNVREQQVFQVMEILKAARDYNFDRFFQIYESLEPRLQRQRVVILIGLDATRVARKRRAQRQMLEAMAEHFPNDPLYSLSLLDYYFPTRRYQEAWDALKRLENKLRIDDAVMAARLSSAALVLGRFDEAARQAEHAVALEPELELGWWSLLRARVVLEQHAGAVEVVDRLQSDYGHTLDPETLAKDPLFRRFMRSGEYQAWAAEHVQPDAG